MTSEKCIICSSVETHPVRYMGRPLGDLCKLHDEELKTEIQVHGPQGVNVFMRNHNKVMFSFNV